jgi:tRNA-splicing endonuclease subunit Sen34
MIVFTGDIVTEPIPISFISGRYLLFDINVVTYLRRTHHICGVLIGSIPQIPQQNVFLGLPVELLPEEAKLLVEKEVAYIVNDVSWHREKFSTLAGEDRRKYLESLRSEGRKSRRVAEELQQKRAERGLAKQAMLRASKDTSLSTASKPGEPAGVSVVFSEEHQSEESLFVDSHPSSPTPSSTSSMFSSAPYTLTPTTTYTPLSLPQNQSQQLDPPVPASYPLFSHLHALDYFITPGLRFGCDYTVYPGDPLRFHSHFLAVGHIWEDEIPLIDLIGGGRLGTGVKKGFLIGGESPGTEEKPHGDVRTFCIEWGGM